MPNLKIYLDQALWDSHGPALRAALPALRDLLIARLRVPPSACQLVILPVHGLPDQPACNVEFGFLAAPERSAEGLRALCEAIRALLGPILGAPPAVRATALDPQGYTALK